MRLSPAAELAVRGVLVLAERHGNGPTTLSSVCSSDSLPKQYLTKIFSSLAKADIVIPIRGKNGGYVLARAPKDITLLQVIEAVEGPLALNYCQHTPPKCNESECLVRPVWTDLQRIVTHRLAGVRLSDCVNGNGNADDPGNTQGAVGEA